MSSLDIGPQRDGFWIDPIEENTRAGEFRLMEIGVGVLEADARHPRPHIREQDIAEVAAVIGCASREEVWIPHSLADH